MIFFPISELISNSSLVVYEFGFTGIKGEGEINNVFSVFPYTLLLSLCLFILVATLFLFKKRVVQTRLTIFNIVLLVGLQGLAYYYTTAAGTELDANYSFTILFAENFS